MAFTLPPAALRAGYRIASYDTIGSTSEEALGRGRAGERGPLWVVSREQTAGRGRRGSAWSTQPGNLAASLLLTTELEPRLVAQIGFVAGLALSMALEAACGDLFRATAGLNEARAGRDRFSLKWPNDVLADGAKLSGILLQTEQAAGARILVVGIGVNVVAAPFDLAYPATSLAGFGCATSAEALFHALADSTIACWDMWDEGRGFSAIRERWLARAAGLGGTVAVKTGEGVARGVFETIDEHGQLVVRVADGSARRISAGEVHFGMTATMPTELRA